MMFIGCIWLKYKIYEILEAYQIPFEDLKRPICFGHVMVHYLYSLGSVNIPQSSCKLVYKQIKILKQDPDIYNYKLFSFGELHVYMKLNPILKLGGKNFELKKKCPDCSTKDNPRQERSTTDTHHGQRIVGSSSCQMHRFQWVWTAVQIYTFIPPPATKFDNNRKVCMY